MDYREFPILLLTEENRGNINLLTRVFPLSFREFLDNINLLSRASAIVLYTRNSRTSKFIIGSCFRCSIERKIAIKSNCRNVFFLLSFTTEARDDIKLLLQVSSGVNYQRQSNQYQLINASFFCCLLQKVLAII